MPVHTLPSLGAEAFEWLVPGMVQEKVVLLLKNLPKGIRKRFTPIGETARRILPHLSFGQGDFYTRLGEADLNLTGIRIDPAVGLGAVARPSQDAF